MTAIPLFPGMNPYLESPYRWAEIHHQLISEIAAALNAQVVPKYRAAVETRVYIELSLVGIPDVFVAKEPGTQMIQKSSVAVATQPEKVTIPSPCEIKEGYLEIRETATRKVITVIELLSPANKRSGEGRKKFPLPLQPEDTEPLIDLKALLNQVCRKTAIDIVIDYQAQPQPALSEEDFSWIQALPTTEAIQRYE